MSLPVVLLAPVTTATGAVTASGTAVHIPATHSGMAFVLNVTAAATAAGDTLDVKVQCRLDGTNWTDVVAFTQVLGNGGALKHVAKISASAAQTMFADAELTAGNVRNLLGEVWRVSYAQVDDGTENASFTFGVTACPM